METALVYLLLVIATFMPIMCILLSRTKYKIKLSSFGVLTAIIQNIISNVVSQQLVFNDLTNGIILTIVNIIFLSAILRLFGNNKNNEICDESGICFYGGYSIVNLTIANWLLYFPLLPIDTDSLLNYTGSGSIFSSNLLIIIMCTEIVAQYLIQRILISRAIVIKNYRSFLIWEFLYYILRFNFDDMLLLTIMEWIFLIILFISIMQKDKKMSKKNGLQCYTRKK